jgi:hypothetical protein
MKKVFVFVALIISLSSNAQTAPKSEPTFKVYVMNVKAQEHIEKLMKDWLVDITITSVDKQVVFIYKFYKTHKMKFMSSMSANGYRNELIQSAEIETRLREARKAK